MITQSIQLPQPDKYIVSAVEHLRKSAELAIQSGKDFQAAFSILTKKKDFGILLEEQGIARPLVNKLIKIATVSDEFDLSTAGILGIDILAQLAQPKYADVREDLVNHPPETQLEARDRIKEWKESQPKKEKQKPVPEAPVPGGINWRQTGEGGARELSVNLSIHNEDGVEIVNAIEKTGFTGQKVLTEGCRLINVILDGKAEKIRAAVERAIGFAPANIEDALGAATPEQQTNQLVEEAIPPAASGADSQSQFNQEPIYEAPIPSQIIPDEPIAQSEVQQPLGQKIKIVDALESEMNEAHQAPEPKSVIQKQAQLDTKSTPKTISDLPIPTVDLVDIGCLVWCFHLKSQKWLPGVVEQIEQKGMKINWWEVRTTNGEKAIARDLNSLRARGRKIQALGTESDRASLNEEIKRAISEKWQYTQEIYTVVGRSKYSYKSLYAALNKLEQQGIVESMGGNEYTKMWRSVVDF